VPFLRVIRDKRGYETTYLMHWYREGNRQRSRILYVFRTPGGVRVGRDALEPEVLRQIEAQHPEIAFDWNVVRDNQQIVETSVEPRRRRPKREDTPAAPPEPVAPPVVAASAPAPPARPPAIPSTIQGSTPDEQIAFLNEWYPILRERIPRRTADPARVEALLALAERLNPAMWTDADTITSGLQDARQALERLSHVFAKRRRRSRRRSTDGARAPSPGSAPLESQGAQGATPAESSSVEDDAGSADSGDESSDSDAPPLSES
jgi:hypothetical protein